MPLTSKPTDTLCRSQAMKLASFDVEKIRKDFPMLAKTMHGKPLIYFDSSATAQKPQCMIDSIQDFYQNHYSTVHRTIYESSLLATKKYQEAREKVQKLLNASKNEEIIFTRGTTDSINLVAYSFGKAFIKPGDEIILTQIEHHANIVPWQMMCEDRQAVLRFIPLDSQGNLNLAEFAKLLNSKTRLVALTHVSNAIGTINPVQEMIQMAHASGSKVLVDGAQAVPHMKVDVQTLDADFYAFSGHKLYGPTGIGILYGKAELLNQMPPYQGGGDMIDKVDWEKTTYNVLPLKFEAGTPLIAEVIGLGTVIDYINTIGFSAIHAHEQELLEYTTKKMESIPQVRIIGKPKEKAAIISFIVEGAHPLDIGTMLDLKGVAIRTGHHCAQPTMRHFGVPATARISFGLYNTKEEIDHFIIYLQEVIELLCASQ
ncbi:Cysteine desulfurase [Neochlamydia sp. AcF95]|nr:Cysteine desulfurase [Neochlamydia sp. AcF95]